MSDDLITIEAEGEHLAWNNELNLMKEELIKFEEVLASISSPSNTKKTEHFQNQFFIQKGIVDKLKNEIQKHDLALERGGKNAFDSIDSQDMTYHNQIKEKVDTQFNIIKDLKSEFKAFIEAQK
ncbi:MAG: hypothetical protein P1U56_19125 [Saprospiraceae bacterium]|nr:hypothetical protein [Saprospiraceae bacterium]